MGSREPVPLGTREVVLNQETVESNGEGFMMMKMILLGKLSDIGFIV
jgi:hypothetical protein